jgi:hypothetical protein
MARTVHRTTKGWPTRRKALCHTINGRDSFTRARLEFGRPAARNRRSKTPNINQAANKD